MMLKSKLGRLFRLLAGTAMALPAGVVGCTSASGSGPVAAGVVAPCPGTSDPIPAGLRCGLACRAALPVRASNSQMFLVDIRVDDKPVLMLVDTGADRTLLSTEAAARIGLPPPTRDVEDVAAFGGTMRVGSTTMRGMTLGTARIPPGRMYLLPQAQAVAGTGGLGYDGVLGDDILGRFQLDLDFRNQTVRLYDGKPCPGPLPGWSAEASVVPFTTSPGSNFPGVTASLDGTAFNTLLDTGAEVVAASDAAARRLGVGPADVAQDRRTAILGAGPEVVLGRLHRFQALGIGAMTVPQPTVAVLPPSSPYSYMIVGDPVLSTRRVWIDYPGRLVHFARPD